MFNSFSVQKQMDKNKDIEELGTIMNMIDIIYQYLKKIYVLIKNPQNIQ